MSARGFIAGYETSPHKSGSLPANQSNQSGESFMKKTARLWCPGVDQEMRNFGQQFITNFGLDGTLYAGGQGGLGDFVPQAKLWILCHGHARMPRFTTSAGRWSAPELAALLAADGLPKAQRDIELLVCHAGESVNSKANAKRLLGLQAKADRHKARGRQIPAGLQAKYKKASAAGQQPQFYESAANASALLLPMAAQLSQALKDEGFTHFRLISYKAPVSMYSHGQRVHVDLSARGGRWGTPITEAPEYRAIWH